MGTIGESTMTSPSGEPAAAAAPVYSLRGCELRIARREILAEDGSRPIEPRAFDVLVYLIEHRDRVVSKEELLRKVWRRVAVSDSVVARTIMKARLAIGDVQPDDPLIRTVHRVGYRFVGQLGTQGAVVRAPAAAGVAGAGAMRIALLPFENRTGFAEMDWLQLGLMSQVATVLAADPRLQIASVCSVLSALGDRSTQEPAACAQAVLAAIGVSCAVHVAVSTSPHGEELLTSIHSAQAVRGLPAIHCDRAVDGVAPLAALLKSALLPDTGGADGEAHRRFFDPFSAEAHARARQVMAEQNWRVAVPLLQVLVDQQPDATDLRLDLLRALAHVGDPGTPALARQLLSSAASVDAELHAAVLRELGAYELNIGRLAQAADHLDAALAQRIGCDDFMLSTLAPRITVALEQNDFDTARVHLGQAEMIIARNGNRLHRTAWLRHAALLERRSGNLDLACRLAEEALATARSLQLRHCVMVGLWTKAGVLAESGRLADAVAAGEEALTLAIALEDMRCIAQTGATLGLLLAELRRIPEARSVLARLEDVAAPDNRWIAGALLMTRTFLAHLRRDRAAVADGYERLLALPEGTTMLLRQRLWPGAGLALVHAGECRHALALIDELRNVHRSAVDLAHCGGLALLEGHMAFNDGDRDGARRHFVTAADHAVPGMWHALACLDGAWLCCEAGEPQTAERLLRLAGCWVDEHPAGMLVRARVEHGFGRCAEAVAWQQRHEAAARHGGAADTSHALLACYLSGHDPGVAQRLPSQA